MNKNQVIMALISATLLTAAIVATLPLQHASAKISESCTNRGGHESEGSCNGNTDSNGKECSAKNPAGKEPGGHNPC
jgi:uncharacterized low-complexity protein